MTVGRGGRNRFRRFGVEAEHRSGGDGESRPMELLNERSAEDWLKRRGLIAPLERVVVRALSGGVSNVVLHVHRGVHSSFVVKQCREQLRVPEPWFAPLERIRREAAVLRFCGRLLTDAAEVRVPQVLFEVSEDYAFGMTAAADGYRVWKTLLLDGETDERIAAACGRTLGRLHAATWHDAQAALALGGPDYFDDLRLDPYYRTAAGRNRCVAAALESLIRESLSRRDGFVHGDFSPKNLLVTDDGLMLVDFEVGHYGDSSFDLGFFLAHLTLKAIRAGERAHRYVALTEAFWDGYERETCGALSPAERRDVMRRGLRHLAGCVLARVDGKSRVEYLTEERQQAARSLALELFRDGPDDWPGVLRCLANVT
ncbi:MAG: phosphotransferase [Planctomycetota bacterium]|nr:MAG: phosphotransferase [Planctomycetota bacterium]